MYKMFVKDAWDGAPSEMKHLNDAGWTWMFAYFGFLLPTYCFQIKSVEIGLSYYTFNIPMLAALFLVRICPNRISKTLLLCPLSVRERQEYVYAGLAIRVGVSVLLFLLCNLPLYVFQNWEEWHLRIEFLYFVLYVVAINIYVPPVTPSRNILDRKYNLPGYYNLWDGFTQINGMIGMVFMVDTFRMESGPLSLWEYIWGGTFISLELICMIVMLAVYFKPVMVQATQCENY